MRSYEQLDFFRRDFIYNVDKGANAAMTNLIYGRWLGLRIDFCIFIFSSAVAVFAVGLKGHIDAALLGFSLQNLTDVVPSISIAVRLYAEFENYMTSS